MINFYEPIVSHHISRRMDFKTSTQFYLNVFYFIGLSPYRPERQPRLVICSKLFAFLPFLILQSCAISSLLILNINGPLPQYTVAETTILNIQCTCDLARSTFLLMQCILFEHTMVELIKILNELEIFFKRFLHHRICYREFIGKYRQKAYFVFSCYLIYVASFAVRVILQDKASTTVARIKKLPQLITACSFVQLLFFIELMSFYLSQLNSVINDDMKCLAEGMWSARSIRVRLKYYKIVYFRIWTVSQRVNRFFGYGLVTNLLDTFICTVYSAFWMYQHFYRNLGLLAIWSKSNAICFSISAYIFVFYLVALCTQSGSESYISHIFFITI